MANKKVNTKGKKNSQEDFEDEDDFEMEDEEFEEEVDDEFDEDDDFDTDDEGEEEVDDDEDEEFDDDEDEEDEEPAPKTKSKKAPAKKAVVEEEDDDDEDDDIDDSDEDEDDSDIEDDDEDEDEEPVKKAPAKKKASKTAPDLPAEDKKSKKKAPAKKTAKKATKEEAPKKEKKGLPTAEEVYEGLAEKNTINADGNPITSSILSEKNVLGVLATFLNEDDVLEALRMEEPFTDKEVLAIKDAVFAALYDICGHGGGFKLAEGVTIRGSYTAEKVWNNIPGKPASKIGSYLKIITNCPAPKSAKQIGEVSKGKFIKASSKKAPAKKKK